jgi:hypothetical protein
VVDYFEATAGGFYVTFKIDEGVESVSWLITHGHLTALSLTHVFPGKWDGDFMPYEVTLCVKPKRPHCYIVAASSDLLPVVEYKRRLVTGVIRDRSDRLSRPSEVRVMASVADVPADAPAAPVLSASNDTVDPMEAVDTILEEMDPAKSSILTSGFINMKRRIDQAESARKTSDAALAASENARKTSETAAKSADINAGLYKSYIGMLKTGLGKTRSGQFINEGVIADLDSPDALVRDNAKLRVIHAAAYGVLEVQGENYFDEAAAAPVSGQKRMRLSERLRMPAEEVIAAPDEGALGRMDGGRPRADVHKASFEEAPAPKLTGRAELASCLNLAYKMSE